MTDTSPKNQDALRWNAPKAPAPPPTPGELYAEFNHGNDHYRIELRDHGAYGVEAQLYHNGDLLVGRRFDERMNPERRPREMAIAWAEEELKVIERGFG